MRKHREKMREKAKCKYEALRNARLLENKARFESLGVAKVISELREASVARKRVYHKRVYGLTPLRHSQRIIAATSTTANASTSTVTASPTVPNHPLPPRRSNRLRRTSTLLLSPKQEEVTSCEEEEEEQRPANAPLVILRDADFRILAESSARRCKGNGRGRVTYSVFGVCCHFCRRKTLCSEEDCKRCGNCDVNEPCLGKTDCSVCHSSVGVLCRGCLNVRYGQEMEEVRKNKGWMCPHCIEAKGINLCWICNSSICLRKRNMLPTGVAIFKAREMGYKSVAHLLMEELKSGKLVKR